MIALLWKDIVVNRTMLLVGFLLVVFTYSSMFAQQIYSMNRFWPPVNYDSATYSALLVSTVVSLMVITISGCQLMSSEHMTRSFEFMNYLPTTRQNMVISRLLAGFLYSIAIVGGNLLMYWMAIKFSGVTPKYLNDVDWAAICMLIVFAFAMFGFGWCASSLLGRPALGFAVAIVMAGTSYFLFFWLHAGLTWLFAGFKFEPNIPNLIAFYSLLGTAAIVSGSYWFARGIEP